MADINRLRQPNVFGGFGGWSGDPFGVQDLPIMQADPIAAQAAYQPPAIQPYGLPAATQGPASPYGMQPPTPHAAPYGPASPNDPGAKIAEFMALLNQAYTPQTQASDRLSELLNNVPQRQSPNWATRLVAGTLGAGARGSLEDQEKALYAPYLRQIQDWAATVDPFYKAAELENRQNQNERTLAGNILTTQTALERQASQERTASERNRIAEEKNQMANQVAVFRANIEAMKAAGYKFDTKGPTVVAMRTNPQTGQPEVRDTGVPTGALSQVDKINLEGEWRVEAARQMGANQIGAAQASPSNVFIGPDGKLYSFAGGQMVPVEGPEGGVNRVGAPRAGAGAGAVDQTLLQNKTRETLGVLNELLDDKGELRPNVRTAIGASRISQFHRIPGTQALAADATIKRFRDMLTLELIAEMKRQTRTGATGLGVLSDRDMRVLESAAAKLNPAMPEEEFAAELRRIREKLQQSLLPTNALEPNVTKGAPTRKPTAAELIQKYGGK